MSFVKIQGRGWPHYFVGLKEVSNNVCVVLQVLAIDFVPLANEFVPLVIEFIALAIEFVALAFGFWISP